MTCTFDGIMSSLYTWPCVTAGNFPPKLYCIYICLKLTAQTLEVRTNTGTKPVEPDLLLASVLAGIPTQHPCFALIFASLQANSGRVQRPWTETRELQVQTNQNCFFKILCHGSRKWPPTAFELDPLIQRCDSAGAGIPLKLLFNRC